MRHARGQDLDRLEHLLRALRECPGLTEKKRGVFYKGSRPFLHFHEDPRGMFADLARGPGVDDIRIDVTETAGCETLLALVRERLRV